MGRPDFALDIRIIDTELPALNDMLRAHARLDVSHGNGSLYSQILVRDGRISGCVKPLFRDVKIYGPQDADESAFHHRDDCSRLCAAPETEPARASGRASAS